MIELSQIPIVRQRHPGLSPEMPYEVLVEYRRDPMPSFEGDMHYALQFCVIMHGGMELLFDGFSRRFEPGEICWTMFWEPHGYRFTARRNLAVTVNIDVDFLGNCDPFGECNWLLPFVMRPERRYCPTTPGEREFCRAHAAQLLKTWRRRGTNWKVEGWLLVHQLILMAVNGLAGENAGDRPEIAENFSRIKAAVNLVRSTDGRAPSLDEAAGACALSPSRFSEIFRHSLGVSYGKFALRARLAAAAKELKSGNEVIEEVAEKWGFFDGSHFCHAFKKLYGCSPRQYQASR